jgi:DNA processing protein
MTLYWVALNSIRGLGPVKISRLIELFHQPDLIFKESSNTLLKTGILNNQCCQQIQHPQTIHDAEVLINETGKAGISIISLADKHYPQYLKEIFAPPPVLFVKGNLSVFKKHAVSIVGTRTPTQYGKTATLQIVKGLVDSNLTIVSGMARGIDTIAHESTLSMNGSTIAVLGCGIDVVYPKSNHDLWERIGEKGVLVSEFNPGTPPEAYNFPRRNRIISGLSAATIVVEAGERSGSLITADYALQQGREVFAVPGPITSPLSSGTFKLLRDGAVPARSGLEIAESLSMVTLSTLKRASVSAPQKIQISLPENEQNIYRFISDQPLRIDELLEISGCTLNETFGILLNLELKGLIKQINGQHYIRTDTCQL